MRPAALGAALIALALSGIVAGCGKADNDAGPGGVSVGEAKALDEAAQMLDAQRPPAVAASSPAAAPDTAAKR